MEGDGGGIRYATHGDAHLAYRSWGSGPPLLYVASQFIPVVAIDEQPAFRRFVEGLARFATVIAFDRLGVGLSDPMVDDPTVDDWADQLVAVLDASGHESAHLLAHAWGGLATVTLAARCPGRVRSLIFAMAAGSAAVPAGHTVDEIVGGARPSAPSAVDFLAMLAPSRVGDQAFRRWWESAGQRGASPGIAQRLLAMQASTDVTPLLADLRVPTLVIDRPAIERRMPGPLLGTQVPGARVVEVAGVDVLVWLPDADAVIEEVEAFVTGTRRSAAAQRRLTTLFFVDVVGSTASASRLGDRRWQEVLDSYEDTVRREIDRHGGTAIDTAGDGFLATFGSPSEAVRCASRLHRSLAELDLEVRVGIHCGEVEVRGDDVGGLGVHLAARVEASATPGRTWVTSTVREAMLGADVRFSSRGSHELKGVPGSWELYEVDAGGTLG